VPPGGGRGLRVLRAAVFSIGSDRETVDALLSLLPRVYENVVFEYGGELYPPPSAYNPSRGQYVSDIILQLVAEAVEEYNYDLGLGVAGFDAYTPGLNFVFGQALLGRGAAVVYTPRLRQEFYGLEPNPQLYRERLLKEAMHELGHALGLEHCPTPGCVMNFSNSIVEVDAKKPAYCRACSRKLRAAGVLVSDSYTLPY
jgi:archaemetzincin